MKDALKVNVHNRFEFVRRDAKTGKVLGEYVAENIILNSFWPRFLSGNNATILSYIHFGSGVVTPQATDTTLTMFVAARTANTVNVDRSLYETTGVASVKKTIRLEDTEYVGITIGEVGFGYGNTAASLMTKALIKDSNGNILTINKNAGEVLDIYATFFVHVPDNMRDNTVAFIPTCECPFVNGMLCISAWPNSFTPLWIEHEVLTITSGAQYTPTSVSYSVAEKKMTHTLGNIVAANANNGIGYRGLNFGGISIKIPNANLTQPAIIKEVIATGDGTTTLFNPAFGNIRSDSAFAVYVDDVEVSATVLKDIPKPQLEIGRMLPSIHRSGHTDFWFMGYGSTGNNWAYAGGELDTYMVFENIFYNRGLDSITLSYLDFYSADSPDGPWTYVAGNENYAGTIHVIPEAHKYKRYWKIHDRGLNNVYSRVISLKSSAFALEKLINIETPPPIGSVITCSYTPDRIAKTDQHVINNIVLSITFNEYTP